MPLNLTVNWQPFSRMCYPISNLISFYDIIWSVAESRHDTIGGMKKLTLSDYQALAEFRYQIRRFLHFSEEVVKRAGLERGQYHSCWRSRACQPGCVRGFANWPIACRSATIAPWNL